MVLKPSLRAAFLRAGLLRAALLSAALWSAIILLACAFGGPASAPLASAAETGQPSTGSAPSSSPAVTAASLPREEAGALRIPVAAVRAPAAALLSGAASAWGAGQEVRIDVNPTPPLYEGDPMDDGFRPDTRVTVVRADSGLFVRLRWTDPTASAPRPAERPADAGDASIYKQHSVDIERFADAACVQIPRGKPVGALPSLMMGTAGQPVDLYLWHAVRGFEKLSAAGRGTTTRTGTPFPGETRRTVDGWETVFQIPDPGPEAALAFAVWDGDRAQRDGLKYFSIWYELAP